MNLASIGRRRITKKEDEILSKPIEVTNVRMADSTRSDGEWNDEMRRRARPGQTLTISKLGRRGKGREQGSIKLITVNSS